MSIKDQLTDMLKDAIKTNDVKTKNVIRQLRTKVSEYCYTQNLPRDSSDDDVWKKVILLVALQQIFILKLIIFSITLILL